jgi:hypothetical protein
MDVVEKRISITELRRLIYDLHDKQSYTGIRFRFLGEMWQRHFLRIFSVSEDQAIFFDEVAKRLLKLTDFSTIMQFEVDHNFQQYLAHFHYNVGLDQE